MLRTVVYMRRSSDDHDDKQVNSIERQWSDLESYIETYNERRSDSEKLKILDPDKDILREDGSAKKTNRKLFNEMIQRINKGKYDAILATEPSRLSRNPLDTGRLIHCLDQEEIKKVVTMKGDFSSSYLDKFTLGLLLSISKYENDLRGANTRSGMAFRKKQGGTTHIAPIGYRNAGAIKGERYVEEDGENFTKLKELWEIFATGKYTVVEIAEIGKNKGITGVKGYGTAKEKRSEPKTSSYRSIFRNRYYTGKVESEGIWIPGNHQNMVSDELFEQVQIVLQKRGYKHSSVKPSYDNLLKGILLCGHTNQPAYLDVKERFTCPQCKERSSKKGIEKCSHCGCKFSSDTWKGESRRYYSFAKGKPHTYTIDGEIKTTKNIPAEYIEGIVEKGLNTISISDNMLNIMKRLLFTEWKKKNEVKNKQKKDLDLRIDELELKERNALETVTGDRSRQKLLDKMFEEYENEIEELKQERARIEEKINDEFAIAWEMLKTLFEAKNIFSGKGKKSFEPKRQLLLSVVSNLKFLDGKIIPDLKKPFDILSSGVLTKKSSYDKKHKNFGNGEWLPG